MDKRRDDIPLASPNGGVRCRYDREAEAKLLREIEEFMSPEEEEEPCLGCDCYSCFMAGPRPLATRAIEEATGEVFARELEHINTTLPQDSAARKEFPLTEGLLRYFPAALAQVARLSLVANEKHNPGEPLHHARGKSMDHADCLLRHLIDMREKPRCDAGIPEVVYVAWRALAMCQEWLELNDGAPLAPNAWEDRS
jgi:hypothetical protein